VSHRFPRRTFLRTAAALPLTAGLSPLGHLLAAAPEGRRFRAGAALSNITPELGGPIIGNFEQPLSEHIHDELHARCLVLDNGETRLAFVVCDLLGGDEFMFEEARRRVTAATGLPAANLFMSCTHTHSATSALGKDRFARQNPSDLDPYQRFVARRIADGVRRAIHNLAPAQIGWGVGSEPNEVFNRRWFMKPGTVPVNPFGQTTDRVKMNPPAGSPDLDRPAGPTDPEVRVIAVRTPEGKPIAALTAYSLHYVGGVPRGEISADYFAVFCDRFQQLLGADRQGTPFVAMLANGTSGNINNINFRTPRKSSPPYVRMREVADNVARAAKAAYDAIAWKDWVPLGARREHLTLRVRHPSSEQLARAKEIVAQPLDTTKPKPLERHYAERSIAINNWPDTIPLPLQVMRVGDVAVGGIPAEVFVEIGLAFKERSPFKPGFIISLCNGYYGYLPTPEQHELGGYETWLGTNRLEVQASNKILDRLLAMAASLKE
jgi:neutral ceramidase